MKKNKGLKKWLSIFLFVVAAILSAIFMGKVAINYNLSDYLGEETQTKIALNIIEDEFGMTGNVQVMTTNVSTKTAEEMVDKIEDIEYVVNVNFDKYDTNYYKDNNALFIIVVAGDDYSEHAKEVVSNIKIALAEYDGVQYGGTAIEKQKLQDSITSEMIYIIAVAICLVIAILLLTSTSWIEPIILLLSSGVAILINRGTNIIFGEISYITNSISAILQLALSIDYSIVLLNAFRKESINETDNNIAMKKAIKSVVKPISASSLTTIAGLLALLFMSFKIGFDIGIVLMKGIVISAITSLTLLPSLVLICNKLMIKTNKKALAPKGRFFAKTAFKWSKVIAPLALVLVVVCGVLQTNNKFIFSDTNASNKKISEVFGNNNSVVVVYKKGDNDTQKENELIERINAYKTLDGNSALSSYTAYSNTVLEEYDIAKANQKLDLDEKDTEMLFTMYELYKNPDAIKMNFEDFVLFANNLIEIDSDVKEFVDNDTVKTIKTINVANQILNNEFTADELYEILTTGVFADNDISLFSIKQIYGMYYYDTIQDNKVDFKTMLNFILASSTNENLSSMFDESVVEQLTNLKSGVDQFETQMETEMTKAMLQGWMYQNANIMLNEEQLTQIYNGYYASLGTDVKDTIPFLPLMKFLVQTGQITDEQSIATIYGYDNLYNIINNKYEYEQFLPTLSNVAYALSGQVPQISVTEEAIEQMYIIYFYQINAYEELKLNGREFAKYSLNVGSTNSVVSSQLNEDSKNKLIDMLTIDTFLTNKEEMNYIKMFDTLNTVKESIRSNISTTDLDKDKVSGVFIKKAIYDDKQIYSSIVANDLLNFVSGNMDSNSLLLKKMDSQKREKVSEAKDKIESANELLIGENYSRMLLSVNLANESNDTTNFVEYLSKEVKDVFGDDAYIAGEIVSTYDLKDSFSHDNTLITVFTLISIFVIVMIVFKSLSLPIILVAVIQGAIFIAMSTLLMSSGIFFMSYIVSTCILMGATIDYGILMSSNYVGFRKIYDKKESLIKAIEIAIPTVFTSGLILTICGFVIFFISSQNSIATVGLLIGIGTIMAIIMILIVLPSLLYLLDKFVVKLTYSKKNK